jgi:PPOX class probable F420-dependent enzyme
MAIHQGDLALLDDPVAQELLRSTNLAKLAYVWTDGTPRVVPIWFAWTGKEIVLGTPPTAPKVKALRANPRVSVTIDSATNQDHVLLMRGTAAVTMVLGVASEYAAAARKYMGEEAGNVWVGEVGTMFTEMARIAIRPDWVGVLDFQTRFPSAMQPFLETAAAQALHQAKT